MDDAVIRTTALSKRFGDIVALHGLDLAIPAGAVYGLVGRNGAGKSTALRLLMGLMRPDQGRAEVLGAALMHAPAALRTQVCWVDQEARLPAWEDLDGLCAMLAGFYPQWDGAHALRLAKRWDLPRDRRVGELSGGQRQRIALLLALAARPRVLLLDEPAGGLDPVARRELVEALVEALADGDGCTVLISTHLIADLERLADRVGILDRGSLRFSERIEDLQQHWRRVQLVFPGTEVPAGFTVAGAQRCSISGPVLTAVGAFEGERLLALHTSGARVQDWPLSLEDIVIEVLGPSAGAAPEDRS